MVALELKFPVVDRSTGEAASREVLQGLWRHLGTQGWQPLQDEHTGRTVGASRTLGGRTDVLSSATGYCVIELSTAPEATIGALDRRVRAALEPVVRHCGEHGAQLLGHGIHPVTAPSPDLLTAKQRNVFWDDVFEGCDPSAQVHLFTVTAASQAHVDVGWEEAGDALAVFNGLAPAQIALTANSAVWDNRVDEQFRNVHESFWDRWSPDEDRVGMPAENPASLEVWLDSLLQLRPVYVERDGGPILISSCDSFAEFCGCESVIGRTADGQPATVQAKQEDLDLHMTFCWHNARISRYCTLENRVNCQQPPESLMAVGALTLGLAERLGQARSLVGRYDWRDLRRGRVDAMRHGLEACVADRPISDLCQAMLEIATEGLQARGHGEEAYLAPLWQRLRRRRSPADQAIACFQQDGIGGLLKRFSLERYPV